MPHRSFVNLPRPSREQVYQEYVEYYLREDPLHHKRPPPTKPYFYKTWKQYVPEVKTMKNIGFEKCAECVFYEEERNRNFLNPAALRELKEASKQHYDDMEEERRGYDARKQMSCRDPSYYLSLVVDGADQSHYGLPHYVQKSKEDRGHKLAVKLVGVLMHGIENDLYLFSMVERFESRANHIIETVHRALQIKKRKLGKLPSTLFVQVDNCTRENKNRYFLGHLKMLVARGVFVEVQMSSLEVGHTHTDVDQSFSCVHKRLDSYPALTLGQFHCELRKSYAPAPHVQELSRVANFSTLCERSGLLTKVSNHTQYRYFRLIRRSNQAENGVYATKCSVKRFLSEEWTDLPRSKGGGFIKTAPDLLSFPKTTTRVLPNIRELITCLRSAEARIRNDRVMQELYELRDRVYTPWEYEGHWTSECFELNGEYKPGAVRSEFNCSDQNHGSPAETSQENLRYEIGEFFAVKPEARYNTPFWIVEITRFIDLNEQGFPRTLEARWYTAVPGTDPFLVTYKPVFQENESWLAEIHVDSVILRFDGLTRRNRLSRETAAKLSRSLGTGL